MSNLNLLHPPIDLPVPEASLHLTADGVFLTDELLFHHQRCQRRTYLDVFGNQEHRDAPLDYLSKLHNDSQAHRREIFKHHPAVKPDYPRKDWVAGAAATLALMQQGVERIAQGILLVELANGIKLISCPDLLIKQPGDSLFGDWHYTPVDIRLGKRPKQDYQIIAAFHAYVLAAVQQVWPDTSWLMLRQRGAYAVNLMEQAPRMMEILQDCQATLLQPAEPEVFISHNRCDLCPWFSHCYTIAKTDNHLSLLPGVTPSRYVHLKALQLTTLEALATVKPHQLELLPGFGPPVAHRMVQQAQATLHNRAIAHHFPPPPHPIPLFTPEELPTAPIELYFDIESAPEQNLIYLHGVLVVDRVQQTNTFYPLLAENPAEEMTIWHQFLDLVWQYPTAPIYHFCPYEVQTVKRLGEQYGTPRHRIDPLLHRFIDLHERITRATILPVESYALKPIARWMGFEWRNPDANGAQAICWFDRWLATGKRSYLEAIVSYNEDDCRATYWVKDWLVQFAEL